MDKPCDNLEQCGFFKKYRTTQETIRERWIEYFCESEEKSEKCCRKQIRKATGKPPVDNMTPTGTIL
jgi:hypothetical protein